MSAVAVERSVSCGSDLCSLWNALTDTDRLNRAVGNERLKLRANDDASAARFVARTRLGGFSVEYEERPYEWVYLQRFKVERRMRNGPVSLLTLGYTLHPEPAGATRVDLKVELTPRHPLLAPVVRLSARQVVNRLIAAIRTIDADVAAGRPPSVPSPAPVLDPVTLDRAAAALRKLEDAPHVTTLVERIRSGGDLDVSRLRPYVLADELDVSRRAMLATCLRAVKAGLLELRWDIVCPSCRTVSNTIPSLSALTDHGACQLCEIQFGLDLDEAVEATFAPARAIRRIDEGPYCIGGPARTPHVVAQAILPPGGVRSIPTPLETGRYRLFLRGGASAAVELVEGAPSSVAITLQGEQPPVQVAPGGALEVTNPRVDERHAKLERLGWTSQAASARELTAMPEFRRDFSSDVLRPGTQLKVSRMGLFFSDLADSTQLYATTGDAAAFRVVQDHFDVLVPIIERHGGALVKTIGDAVMAAFADELAGVRASAEILSEFTRFRAAHPERQRTDIKLGFFSGACFALTANNVLDYFGQTVNIAARLQGQAGRGELVLSAALAEEAIAAGVLREEDVVERWEARLKGVEGALPVARIRTRSRERALGAA